MEQKERWWLWAGRQILSGGFVSHLHIGPSSMPTAAKGREGLPALEGML